MSYDVVPPGGYPFAEGGAKPRRFASQPSIEAQARTVQGYRKGNGLPRTTYAECVADVDHYVATEILKGSPKFTVQVSEDLPEAVAMSANAPGMKPCAGCGVPLDS